MALNRYCQVQGFSEMANQKRLIKLSSVELVLLTGNEAIADDNIWDASFCPERKMSVSDNLFIDTTPSSSASQSILQHMTMNKVMLVP